MRYLLFYILILSFIPSYSQITWDGTVSGSDIRIVNSLKRTYAVKTVSNTSFVVTGAGKFEGDWRIRNCNVRFQNPTNYFLNYSPGTTNNSYSDPDDDLIITDGSVLQVQHSSSRTNIRISELSNKSSIVVNNTGTRLFVYTEGNARFVDCKFDGIETIETIGQFSQFYNVDFINTKYVMLNWNAGRIDRYGINVPSTRSGWETWIGTGNPNNAIWDWNPRQIRSDRIIHQSNNNRYYQGYTASFKFRDRVSELPVSDVYVGYSDNRSGTNSRRAEFVSNANGVLTGTVDTKTMTNGANIERPVLYLLTLRTVPYGGSVNTGWPEPPTRYNYNRRNITIQLDIRSYLHQEIPKAFSINSEKGLIDENQNVVNYFDYYLKPDANITNNSKTAVLAYTEIDDLNEFYDRAKAVWRQNNNYPLIKASGGIIDLPANWNLVVDGTAANAYSVNTGTRTITIKSTELKKSDKFSRIRAASGQITFRNGGYIDCKYTDVDQDAYVRIIYLNAGDRVTVRDRHNNLLFDHLGEGGYAYTSGDGNHRVEMDAADGVSAMKFYNSVAGVDNIFFINFTTADNTFTNDDRITLYETSEEVKTKMEKVSGLLERIKVKLREMKQEVQHSK